jgi:DNA-binding NtrC family response regulator
LAGNIRELRNVIERAVALCPGPYVQLADLREPLTTSAKPHDSLTAGNLAQKTDSLTGMTLVEIGRRSSRGGSSKC